MSMLLYMLMADNGEMFLVVFLDGGLECWGGKINRADLIQILEYFLEFAEGS